MSFQSASMSRLFAEDKSGRHGIVLYRISRHEVGSVIGRGQILGEGYTRLISRQDPFNFAHGKILPARVAHKFLRGSPDRRREERDVDIVGSGVFANRKVRGMPQGLFNLFAQIGGKNMVLLVVFIEDVGKGQTHKHGEVWVRFDGGPSSRPHRNPRTLHRWANLSANPASSAPGARCFRRAPDQPDPSSSAGLGHKGSIDRPDEGAVSSCPAGSGRSWRRNGCRSSRDRSCRAERAGPAGSCPDPASSPRRAPVRSQGAKPPREGGEEKAGWEHIER